jgi:hypothetical protein
VSAMSYPPEPEPCQSPRDRRPPSDRRVPTRRLTGAGALLVWESRGMVNHEMPSEASMTAKRTSLLARPWQPQYMTIISEPGLYEVPRDSRKPRHRGEPFQ